MFPQLVTSPARPLSEIMTDIGPYDQMSHLDGIKKITEGADPADILERRIRSDLRPMPKACWYRDPS